MSFASRRSYNSKGDGQRRPRPSRAAQPEVSYDDAYSYALRVAVLNYLLQPRKKRKEYISQPKQPVRSNTVGMLGEVFGLGEAHAPSMKLPSGFRVQLEKRLSGVVTGKEHMAGYSDALLRRTFAEAYTTFTEKNFQKSVDKDRKVEPLFLMFYTAATKALGRGKDPTDKSWTFMVDRHTAMFLRLMTSVLRDHGADRDRPELIQRLTTLESKLLTSDQNLLDTSQGENKYIEVEIPPTYEVKDMHMVQVVAKIFGVSNTRAQADIDANKAVWTEEAAVKDLKQYQTRLSSNMAGTLRRQDFDLDAAFEEWKKNENHLLGQIFTDILSARPELRGTSSSTDKPLPTRPQSMYAREQAYADLSKMLAEPDAGGVAFDQPVNLSGLSLEDSTSIRSVDEPNYTFIPPEPRAFYKKILYYAMLYESLQSDPSLPYAPLGEQSTEVLIELSVRWRIPQFTRYVTFTEVAVRMFRDQELTVGQLDLALESLKSPPHETKKVPAIQSYTAALPDLDFTRWTITDFAAYQHALGDAYVTLLRDLYDALVRCYEPKPPSIKDYMMVLGRHIFDDPAFAQRPEDTENFRQQLDLALREKAALVYRDYVDTIIPQNQEDWDFSHVVQLGKAVTSICQRIKKRYKNNPEILGVSPYDILVQTMFPTFEEDANEFISRVLLVAKERGEPVNKNDGFELYKELVEIRGTHLSDPKLRGTPFAFHIEGLLEEFVWRHIKDADEQMEVLIDNAIKQDQFQLVSHKPDGYVEDGARHSTSVVDVFALFNQTHKSVEDLQWQDAVHVARFKKALAKSFAAGIGRYCEVVESRFAKEMDRQTVQEVAAATKTAQERFLQYARDALTTKERIEPFQFYPESFVKLNNIEFAMQALDKLENEMKVSECAELLRRVEAPKQQARRPNKYIFTIKVVEGEDLKACDPSGYSDPYVVLCDEYQKRLLKTQVKYSTLNPHWNESFDITVSGPLNIIATIWDWDRMGDHDFVGRTSLKLDPVHFSDYLPREFWLDLDTQGRLLIRVSMEGERDDIEFYFGKAFRHLKRTERDMVRKITDKLTSHINASLSRQALKNLVGGSLTASVASLWKKRQSSIPPATTQAAVEQSLFPLFDYFQDNFTIMNLTLTHNTMQAVMARLWKEVLMAIENLLVPPLSEQPSAQKPLTQAELDIVFKWLNLLFDFFNDRGEGVPVEVLKSPKWQDLQNLNFFYFETTENLIRTSETIAAANAQKVQQQLAAAHNNRHSAPALLGPPPGNAFGAAAGFGSLGTIRRGRSIMMSRNLGTMRRAKEERRKEAREDASDDMILRILRMRPEAGRYLLERQRQKTRQESQAAAQAIVRQSVHQGWNAAGGGAGAPPLPAFGGALYGRNNLPRR